MRLSIIVNFFFFGNTIIVNFISSVNKIHDDFQIFDMGFVISILSNFVNAIDVFIFYSYLNIDIVK